MVHERAQVVRKVAEAQLAGIAEGMGRSVAARVEGDQAHSPRRHKQAEGLVCVCAQAVLKEKRSAIAATVAIVERDSILSEGGHRSVAVISGQ